MATTKATLVYDTYVYSEEKRKCYDDEKYTVASTDLYTTVQQYDIPSLPDTVIKRAKLRLFILSVFTNGTITTALYRQDQKFYKLTYNTWSPTLSQKILDGKDTFTFGAGSQEYNSWIELDITDLVSGNLGKKNFTIGINSKRFILANISSGRGQNPPELVIEYQDATPFVPTIVYPDGEIIENSGNVRFSWNYNGNSGSSQTKFDLDWKMQSDERWTTVTQSTGNQYYDIDASNFKNGIVEWRVRTYNSKGLASDYATAQFFVVGKPGKPFISSIKNDAITEIAWTANKSEEASARLEILQGEKLLISSGEIAAGIADVWKPNIMLPNGSYVVTLEISNIYGIWSNKIAKTFNIGLPVPERPELNVHNQGDHVRLVYTGGDTEFFIFRSEDGGDYIPITRTRDKIYTDYAIMSGKRYSYFIRAYNGGFSDSSKKDASILYRGYIISALSGYDRVMAYLGEEEYINPDTEYGFDVALTQYIGREYPVREASGFKQKAVSFDFFVHNADYKKLESILDKNQPICIRCADFRLWCSVGQYGSVRNKLLGGYNVILTGNKIDYKEAVEYA